VASARLSRSRCTSAAPEDTQAGPRGALLFVLTSALSERFFCQSVGRGQRLWARARPPAASAAARCSASRRSSARPAPHASRLGPNTAAPPSVAPTTRRAIDTTGSGGGGGVMCGSVSHGRQASTTATAADNLRDHRAEEPRPTCRVGAGRLRYLRCECAPTVVQSARLSQAVHQLCLPGGQLPRHGRHALQLHRVVHRVQGRQATPRSCYCRDDVALRCLAPSRGSDRDLQLCRQGLNLHAPHGPLSWLCGSWWRRPRACWATLPRATGHTTLPHHTTPHCHTTRATPHCHGPAGPRACWATLRHTAPAGTASAARRAAPPPGTSCLPARARAAASAAAVSAEAAAADVQDTRVSSTTTLTTPYRAGRVSILSHGDTSCARLLA
jgi:hypothetical protein